MKRYAFLFSLILANSLTAQPVTHKVILNKYIEDEKGKKMQSVIAVYRYTGQPFEDPINLGVDTKKESGSFYAKLPDMTGVRDTSYAYIYFGGVANRKDLKGYTLMIIGRNHRHTSLPAPLLWIDKNNNLDLSDDGPPDTFKHSFTDMDITLLNPDVKNATYTVNITRFPMGYNASYIGKLDDYYNANKGKKTFISTMFSFREQRINTIAGDFKFGNDSFTLGIKDVNCNGLYHDAGADYILVGDYKVKVLPDNITQIDEKTGKTFFERNGKRYVIDQIDPVGAFITFHVDEGAKLVNSLQVGKKIRKFKFTIAGDKESKQTISTRKYRKKPTYIYVWRFDQEGLAEDTAALRIIARDYSHRINLLTLNYGETPNVLKGFRKRNHINWTIGQSTLKINKRLYVEKYPTGILTKKHLKVDKIGISPSELLTLLKNNLI